MLFACDRPALLDVPVKFVYTVLDSLDQQQQQHSIRYGADARPHPLTKMRQQITTGWLTETNLIASECRSSSNVTLDDVLRQQRQTHAVVGNFTTHTFSVADTYQVKYVIL